MRIFAETHRNAITVPELLSQSWNAHIGTWNWLLIDIRHAVSEAESMYTNDRIKSFSNLNKKREKAAGQN